jgi:hypothetical protein
MSDTAPANNIETLRNHLFAALEGVKKGELDLDRARAVNELAKTIVDTARVEVDFIRATDGTESAFLTNGQAAPNPKPQLANAQPLPNGIVGITRHALR